MRALLQKLGGVWTKHTGGISKGMSFGMYRHVQLRQQQALSKIQSRITERERSNGDNLNLKRAAANLPRCETFY